MLETIKTKKVMWMVEIITRPKWLKALIAPFIKIKYTIYTQTGDNKPYIKEVTTSIFDTVNIEHKFEANLEVD
jgi:hypothetical protein